MEIVVTILILIGAPVSIYFSVKFGRYAYLKANQLFSEEQKPESAEQAKTKK